MYYLCFQKLFPTTVLKKQEPKMLQIYLFFVLKNKKLFMNTGAKKVLIFV